MAAVQHLQAPSVSTKLLTRPGIVFNSELVSGICKDPSGQHAAAISRDTVMVFGFHNVKNAETELLETFERDTRCIAQNGENIFVVWSPDSKRIAVVTHLYRVIFLKVKYSDTKWSRAMGGSSATKRRKVASLVEDKIVDLQGCLPSHSAEVVGVHSVGEVLLIGTQNVYFITLRWDGKVEKSCQIFPDYCQGTGLRHFCVNETLSLLGMTLIDGRISVCGLHHVVRASYSENRKSTLYVGNYKKVHGHPFYWVGRGPQILPLADACCASFNERYGLVAVGDRQGKVTVLKLDWASTTLGFEPHFSVSMDQWGKEVGHVERVQWSEDGSSLLIGFQNRGFCVYAADGTRVLCPFKDLNGKKENVLFKARVQAACWIPTGLMLGLSATGYVRPCIVLWDTETWAQGNLCPTAASRKTLVVPGGIKVWSPKSTPDDPHSFEMPHDPWEHIDIPAKLLKSAWPFKEVCANSTMSWLAVASFRGHVLLHQRRTEQWQILKLERSVKDMLPGRARASSNVLRKVVWDSDKGRGLGRVRICCMAWVASHVLCIALERQVGTKSSFSLCFYSCNGSVVTEIDIVKEPLGMEEQGGLLLVYFADRVVHIYEVSVGRSVVVKNYSVFQVVRELEPHPTRVRLWAQNASGKALDGETRVVVLRMDGRLTIQDLRGELLHDISGCKDFFLQPVSTLPKRDHTHLWVQREATGLELWLQKNRSQIVGPGNVQMQAQMQQVQRRNSFSLSERAMKLSPSAPLLAASPRENILEFKRLVVDALGGMIPLGIDSKHGTILLAKRVWLMDRDNPAINIRTQRRTFFDRLIGETLPLEGVERTVKFAKESFDHGLFQPTKTMHLFLRQTLRDIDPRFAKNLPGGATRSPKSKKKLTKPPGEPLSKPQRSELKKRTVSMSESVTYNPLEGQYTTDLTDEEEECSEPGCGGERPAGGPLESPPPERPAGGPLEPPIPGPAPFRIVDVASPRQGQVQQQQRPPTTFQPGMRSLPVTPAAYTDSEAGEEGVKAVPGELCEEDPPLGIQFLKRLDLFEEVVLKLAVMEVEQKLWPLLFKICGQPDKLFSQLVYPTVTGLTQELREKRLETAVNYLRILELFDFSSVEIRAKELMAQARRQEADRILPMVQKYIERHKLIQTDVDAGAAPPCIAYS